MRKESAVGTEVAIVVKKNGAGPINIGWSDIERLATDKFRTLQEWRERPSLPSDVRTASTLSTFKNRLKLHFFLHSYYV